MAFDRQVRVFKLREPVCALIGQRSKLSLDTSEKLKVVCAFFRYPSIDLTPHNSSQNFFANRKIRKEISF